MHFQFRQINRIGRQSGSALLFLLLVNMALAQSANTPAAQTQYQSKEFEEALHAYLINHPEVVMEAMNLYQAKQQAAKQQGVKEAVLSHQAELLTDPDGSPVKAKEGAVTVVEFFDYRCGYCKKMQSTIEKIGSGTAIRVLYKELPILGPESLYASKAALAAAKQGSYDKFHQALMNAAEALTPESVDKIAAGFGLNLSQLKKDMDSPEVTASIMKNSALAESLGIEATPTFVVGKEVAPGALSEEALNSLIESQRSKTKPAVVVSAGSSL